MKSIAVMPFSLVARRLEHIGRWDRFIYRRCGSERSADCGKRMRRDTQIGVGGKDGGDRTSRACAALAPVGRASPIGSPPGSGSSRQGCGSCGVRVPAPSIGRFGRLASPMREEVTNHVLLGTQRHGRLAEEIRNGGDDLGGKQTWRPERKE